MQSGIPAKPEEIPVGRNKDSERPETSNLDRSVYGLCHHRSTHNRPSTGGTGVCDGGRRGPGGYGRHGGTTAVDRSGYNGTSDVTVIAADFRSGSQDGL